MNSQQNDHVSQKGNTPRAMSHSLCQELQQACNGWCNDDFVISKHIISEQSESDNQFSSDIENANIKIKQYIDIQNKSTDQSDQKQLQIDDQMMENNNQQIQNNQSPKTITLIDQQISKQNIKTSSLFYQYFKQIQNQSYTTFLHILENDYLIIIQNFQQLFNNVYDQFIQQKLKNIQENYFNFIKKKYQQQKIYSVHDYYSTFSNNNCLFGINTQNISKTLKSIWEKDHKKHQIYVKNLEDVKNKFQSYFQNVKSQIKLKSNKIKEIGNKLSEISEQMNNLMIPERRKINKKKINPQIYSNAYIRTKYLMGKQKTYLSLISSYLHKIVNFISYICMEVQQKNCLIVKECLLQFADAVTTYRPEVKHSLLQKVKSLEKSHCYLDICTQISHILQQCIPQPISPHNQKSSTQHKQHNEKYLKTMIQLLIKESQSLVYIPVIQIQNKDYVYHSKNKANIKWQRLNHIKKYKSQRIQSFQIYIIVTNQGYLVLEVLDQDNKVQDKIAILKLNQIKISRKNDKIILTDSKKGLFGYIVSSHVILGTLIFQPIIDINNEQIKTKNQLIQEFIYSVKSVLQQKKNRKCNKNQVL